MKTNYSEMEPDIDRIAEERFLALQGNESWEQEKDMIELEEFKEREQNYDPTLY